MNNTTYSAKKGEVESKWYIIDAANKPLGRVATEAARLLRGKHKPTFTPNIDMGDHVIIINCNDVILTGNKLNQKVYRHHSGYIGGMKEISFKEMFEKNPNITIEEVRSNLEMRDYIDSHREVSPLRKADDAVVIDNTHLTEAEQLHYAIALAMKLI